MDHRLRTLGFVAIAAALGIMTMAMSSRSLPGGADLAGPFADEGYPIDDETVIARCARCHERDDEGRMTRISYERKTPEGWQTSLRRMVALNSLRITPEEARQVVRYLSNNQGLAPEELEPGRFEVERRMIDYTYDGDSDVEFTCIQCHSMGRVITQRRTREEWELLLATHRGLYPLVDFQAFRRLGPPPEAGPDGTPPDTRQPMDVAIDHLSAVFPLDTPEWSAWKATMRPARLAGTWIVEGHEPGRGPLYGTVTITPGEAEDEFETRATYRYAESGDEVARSGQAVVYTGYQWRGRSNPGAEDELREVMSVDRGWNEMTGRWFSGAYDEHGPDVTLRRANGPAIAGAHPRALARGSAGVEVRVFGASLPGSAADYDLGPRVTVASASVSGDGAVATLRVSVASDAVIGARDLFAGGASRAEALVIHDGVDRLEVTPATGMARVGGANFPKGYQVFDAIGWDDGLDGESGTDDDLRLGRVPVEWTMEEFSATFDDDDVEFVGSLGADGSFTPGADGPNPARRGSRNNVGDVWVVATLSGAELERPLRARAHLIVTVPLYLRFDPWEGAPPTRLVP